MVNGNYQLPFSKEAVLETQELCVLCYAAGHPL
jgi:hypothetical protein